MSKKISWKVDIRGKFFATFNRWEILSMIWEMILVKCNWKLFQTLLEYLRN